MVGLWAIRWERTEGTVEKVAWRGADTVLEWDVAFDAPLGIPICTSIPTQDGYRFAFSILAILDDSM